MTIFVNLFIESVTKYFYHNDIKCHRTLNIVFSVITDEPVEIKKSLVEVQDFRKFTDHFR